MIETRREIESLIVKMKTFEEPIVGLPYYIVRNLGEKLVPPPDTNDIQNSNSFENVRMEAGRILDLLGVSSEEFSKLNDNFEFKFQNDVKMAKIPPHIAGNPAWLAEWKNRGEQIIVSSITRMSKEEDEFVS